MANPRDYYESHLFPAYQEWCKRPHEEWLAKAAVADANNLAERFAIYLKLKPTEYRRELRKKCPEFGWIWDIADGSKHYELDRKDADISHTNQVVKSEIVSDFSDIDSIPDWDNHAVFVVTDNAGNKRNLDKLMEVVVKMYEQLLAKYKL